MRQFVVLGHDAPTSADFSLDDLAGGAGRLDVLARCVNSAFFLSHGIREDVRLFLVHSDALTIRLEASELKYVNPDERNIASILKKAIDAKSETVGHMEVEPTPGVHVSKRGFESVLQEVIRTGTIVQLHEDGDPIVDVDPPENPAFVLSDHHDFADWEQDLIAENADHRVRVGPELLHADHTITVAHNYLDTAGFTEY